MKLKAFNLALVLLIGGSFSVAQNQTVSTIEEYNALVPNWGISWSPGAGAVNGYYPTFYTGFVMRQQNAERIHVHVGRGNNTRVSVILDETTVSDYMFDLAARYSFYNKVTSGNSATLNINPKGAKFLPQLSYFNQVLESRQYGILDYVKSAVQGSQSDEQIYQKGLETLSKLNPGRVFNIQLDLKKEFLKWKADVQRRSGGDSAKVIGDAKSVVTTINTLVWGRVNYIAKPTDEVMAKLKTAVDLAIANASDEQFVPAALELFKATTGAKYQIKVMSADGKFTSPIQCSAQSCMLNYPEFSTVYPTGSMEAKTSDEFGNRINQFATPGLWQFMNYPGKEVDNIRNEPHYGFIPKMDYEGIGNGFHNPAVRFWNPASGLKQALGINPAHNTLWAVKRGGVSHGCLRLPAGHVWELRQIFPVENSKMTQVPFFGNNSGDFDVYDINGDGTPEVMGVQYLISYGLQGASGLARREGQGFEVNADKKLEFYEDLYGARNVFRTTGDGKFIFSNPKVSVHSHLDFKKKTVGTRMVLNGEYELYEQTYEKEKVQLYSVGSSMGDTEKRKVRLMGRVRGCAPKTDKQACGQAAFEQEARGLVR